MRGVVSRFFREKGYGFIKPLDGSPDVFVHYTGIGGEGYRNLKKDELVEFDVVQDQRGAKAVNVTVVVEEA